MNFMMVRFTMPVSKVYEGIVFEEQASAPDMR